MIYIIEKGMIEGQQDLGETRDLNHETYFTILKIFCLHVMTTNGCFGD